MMKFQMKQVQQATFCAQVPLLFNIRTCRVLLGIWLPSQRQHFPAVLTSRGGHVSSCGQRVKSENVHETSRCLP